MLFQNFEHTCSAASFGMGRPRQADLMPYQRQGNSSYLPLAISTLSLKSFRLCQYFAIIERSSSDLSSIIAVFKPATLLTFNPAAGILHRETSCLSREGQLHGHSLEDLHVGEAYSILGGLSLLLLWICPDWNDSLKPLRDYYFDS
jgi:hypothetical protein